MKKNKSRREFIGQASCAGMGYLTFMNTLLNLRGVNASAISNSAVADANDYRAIVCILLAGGNDSYNMLMPYDTTEHGLYATARSGLYTAGNSGLAIPRSMLQNTKIKYEQGNREWALHPSMVDLKNLFDNDKVALLANIGTLLKPTSAEQYDNENDLPVGLFSHSDQIEEWQTGMPHKRAVKGWGGRMADLIGDCNANQSISMNVSLSGTNIWQQGNNTVEYAIDGTNGAIEIQDYDESSTSVLTKIKTEAVNSMLGEEYKHIFKRTYRDVITSAKDGFLQFNSALENSIQFAANDFPDNQLGNALQMIARVIDVRNTLGYKRQTFFITVGGWDHHDEVIDKQNGMLGMVSQALNAFQNAMAPNKVGMEDNVLTMMISEFGRTLTSNGNGSDHAWGGNTLVMGGPNLVDGGKMYGAYPTMSDANPDPKRIERGRFIPSLSTDEYFAEVARWFGVPNTDLSMLFPNIGEFYDTSSNTHPIGFLKV